MVFNKLDLVDRELFENRFRRQYPEAVFVAGRTEEGPTELRDAILARVMGQESIRTVAVPITNLHCLSRFHRTGSVLDQTFNGDICHAVLRLTEAEFNRLVKFDGAVPVEDGP